LSRNGPFWIYAFRRRVNGAVNDLAV
jgi:hypothetical protein